MPAASTPLGLHVMENGFLAAPEGGASVEHGSNNMFRRTHAKTDEVHFL